MSYGALYAQSSDLKKYGLGVYIDSKGLAKIAIVFTWWYLKMNNLSIIKELCIYIY